MMLAGRRRVLWHNMREEPVLYINGRPYVVREANKPFANLEYTGALAKLLARALPSFTACPALGQDRPLVCALVRLGTYPQQAMRSILHMLPT